MWRLGRLIGLGQRNVCDMPQTGVLNVLHSISRIVVTDEKLLGSHLVRCFELSDFLPEVVGSNRCSNYGFVQSLHQNLPVKARGGFPLLRIIHAKLLPTLIEPTATLLI